MGHCLNFSVQQQDFFFVFFLSNFRKIYSIIAAVNGLEEAFLTSGSSAE